MSFNKDESAGFLANHMARLYAHGLHERIRPLGLAPAQFMCLLELWEDDGITQKALRHRLDVEQATMANTLKRMERDGLIVRRPDPADQRAQRIHLTDRARALRDDAIAAAGAQNRASVANLTEDERAQFVALMQKVIATMRGDAQD